MTIITDIRKVIRYWWVFILLGSLLILFGLVVMSHRAATFADLAIFFAIAFLVNGLLEITFAISNYRSVHGWGWHLAGGIFDLLLGLILASSPVLAAVSLVYFAGFWLLFRSIAIIGRCFDLPVIRPERTWMLLLGLAGLICSFMILYNPQTGVFTVVLWAAFALISIGLFYIFLGLHLRKFGAKPPKNQI